MVWLLGDHNQVRRQQFKDAGWVIGLSSNRSLNKSKRRTLRSRFADDQPHLLYVVNLGGMGDTEDVSSFIAVLMQDQLNLRGLILLEAPESSKLWQMPHGKLTEHRDWHPTVTRWCGLTSQTAKGELSDTHSTSKRSTYVRSNFPLEDRRNCTCGRSWNDHTSHNDRNEDGDSAFAAYMATLLSERYFIGHACVSSFPSPLVPMQEAASEVFTWINFIRSSRIFQTLANASRQTHRTPRLASYCHSLVRLDKSNRKRRIE